MADRGARRIDRKALRQPDEFVTSVGRTSDWVREHQQAVVLAAGALVAVLLIAGLIGWNAARQRAQAAARFHQAYTAFRGERWDEAARAFAEVAETYPGNPFGRLARLYQGHARVQLDDEAGARTAYQTYLDGSLAEEYLRQIALVDLADAQERAGDPAAARQTYAEAAAVPGPFRRAARLAEARLALATGDRAAAEAVYREELERGAEGALRSFLESRIPATERPETTG